MKRERGFTIIELMTSIVILSVLAFLAAPAMFDLIQRSKIDATTSDLMRSVVAARTEAVARNQSIVICSSSDAATCTSGGWSAGWLTYVDTDRDGTMDAGEEVLTLYQLMNDATLTTNTANVHSMSFNSDGTLDEAISFRVCGETADPDSGYSIAISVTGRPRSSKGVASCL